MRGRSWLSEGDKDRHIHHQNESPNARRHSLRTPMWDFDSASPALNTEPTSWSGWVIESCFILTWLRFTAHGSGDGKKKKKKKKELRRASCLTYEVFSHVADMLWWPFQLNNKGRKSKVMKWKRSPWSRLSPPRRPSSESQTWLLQAGPADHLSRRSYVRNWHQVRMGCRKWSWISAVRDANSTIYDISTTTLAKW